MPDTTFVIGNITLQGFEIPERVGFGGRQSLAVHKYLGGAKVIDSLGPDDRPLKWSGTIFSTATQSANDRARAIDALRKAGNVATLSWYSNTYSVVIESFEPEWERYYQIPYEIECVVLADLTAPTTVPPPSADQLVPQDLSGVLTDAQDTLNMTVPSTMPGPYSDYSGAVTTQTSDITWNGGGGTDLTETADALTGARSTVNDLPALTSLDPTTLAGAVDSLQAENATIIATQSAADSLLNVGTPNGNAVGGVVSGVPPTVNATQFGTYQAAAQQSFGLINVSAGLGRMTANLSLGNSGGLPAAISW